MDVRINERQATVTALVLLVLYLLFMHFAGLGADGKKMSPQPTQPLQVYPTVAPQSLSNVVMSAGDAAFRDAASPYPAIGSVWRFMKFNLKEVGLFESVDTPGLIIKAKCQQPDVAPPQPGTLYQVRELGILTPVSNNLTVQNFAIVK